MSEKRRVIDYAVFREVLLYCIPALAVGIALRAALTVQMPWGAMQYDTGEYLATPFRLLTSGAFFVDGKRGFLVPILFTIPFLLHIPALIAIPLGQHLLGLAATAMSGALTRFWFRSWRWFIVPVTLVVAANPSMLWYEQVIMGESEYLFSLIFLALAGTLWARNQSRGHFAMLIAALVCATGSRPEGRLFIAFGVLLALLVLWRQWRRLGYCVGTMLAVGLAGTLIAGRSTAPQLLYASLVQLAPDHSRLLPGVEPYIIPLRDQVRAQSPGDPQQLVKVSKEVRHVIDPYLSTKSSDDRTYYKELNRTLRDLCLDAILTHPFQAMIIPLRKFRLAADSLSAYQFTEAALHKNQVNVYLSDKWLFQSLGKGLTGGTLDEAGMRDFVEAHYQPGLVAWLGKFQRSWNRAMIWCRTADRHLMHKRWVHDFAGGVPGGLVVMPGLPWFYPAALLGMIAAIIRPHPSRRVHRAWTPVLLGVWYVATFVGVTNARYRFANEPFCFVYLCLLGDCLTWIWRRILMRPPSDSPPRQPVAMLSGSP